MKDLGWCVATKKEIEALEIMVHVVRGLFLLERALGSEWVYKIKYHSDGNKEHLKTRLVYLATIKLKEMNIQILLPR